MRVRGAAGRTRLRRQRRATSDALDPKYLARRIDKADLKCAIDRLEFNADQTTVRCKTTGS
jgi:hypothetical protein